MKNNEADNRSFSSIFYFIVFFILCFIAVIILIPDKYENYEKIEISDTNSHIISGIELDDDNTLEICLYTDDGIVINKTYDVNEEIFTNKQEKDIFTFNNLIPGTIYYIKSSVYNSKNALIKENYDMQFIPTKEDVIVEISYIG